MGVAVRRRRPGCGRKSRPPKRSSGTSRGWLLMRRSDVPTPALLVNIEILDRNIALMRERAGVLGVKLRPHAKAHKCVEIGQRIMAAGPIGISCATINEAEAMALGGITGILVTAPLVSPDAIERLRQ